MTQQEPIGEEDGVGDLGGVKSVGATNLATTLKPTNLAQSFLRSMYPHSMLDNSLDQGATTVQESEERKAP